MRLVEAGRRVYNDISSYANKKLRQNPPAFDEAYTELRVKNRLKEKKE